MNRIYVLLILIAIASCVKAQDNYAPSFEVHTALKYTKAGVWNRSFTVNKDSLAHRLNAIPDTSITTATFVFTNVDIKQLDSVHLSLTNSLGQLVLNTQFAISTLITESRIRIDGNTLFIKAGDYPYLKRFTARLIPVINGVGGTELVFTKTQ